MEKSMRGRGTRAGLGPTYRSNGPPPNRRRTTPAVGTAAAAAGPERPPPAGERQAVEKTVRLIDGVNSSSGPDFANCPEIIADEVEDYP